MKYKGARTFNVRSKSLGDHVVDVGFALNGVARSHDHLQESNRRGRGNEDGLHERHHHDAAAKCRYARTTLPHFLRMLSALPPLYVAFD